nr:hypothetical protein CFP56_31764 [Quercus suber]
MQQQQHTYSLLRRTFPYSHRHFILKASYRPAGHLCSCEAPPLCEHSRSASKPDQSTMRQAALLTVLAGLAIANPVPQDIDWDAVAEAEAEYVVPEAIPVIASDAEAKQTVVTYLPTQAASAVAAAVTADPTDAIPVKLIKRGCAAASDDTAESFASNTAWAAAATSAPTPSGYVQAFSVCTTM